jgi:small subunit ribosomal protein S5
VIEGHADAMKNGLVAMLIVHSAAAFTKCKSSENAPCSLEEDDAAILKFNDGHVADFILTFGNETNSACKKNIRVLISNTCALKGGVLTSSILDSKGKQIEAQQEHVEGGTIIGNFPDISGCPEELFIKYNPLKDVRFNDRCQLDVQALMEMSTGANPLQGQGDSEWQERVVQIRRVTKVVKGGKKMSFRAVVVIGNGKGQVGVGVGKAGDVIGAVRKGAVEGKNAIISVPLTVDGSIPCIIEGRYNNDTIIMSPSVPGFGVIAGGSTRTVLELAGVKNILAKQLGDSSPLNDAKAVLAAFSSARDIVNV